MGSNDAEGVPDALGIFCNLWGLMESVLDEVEPALSDLGMSPKAFFLLQLAGEHPSPAELARRMHLPPPTVTYLIKHLEGRGYLVRRAVPGDLRRFHLSPSPAGLEALRIGSEALGAVFGARMARLRASELAEFHRSAGRLAAPPGLEP